MANNIYRFVEDLLKLYSKSKSLEGVEILVKNNLEQYKM